MPALFWCGAARRVCITKPFKAESEARRAQEMDGLRRQALASVIDSAVVFVNHFHTHAHTHTQARADQDKPNPVHHP